MTEVISETLVGHDPATIGLLAGPNLAREVMAGHPSATCVAFDRLRYATDIQHLLTSDRLRIYTSADVVGCEISGAVKNVIAIAAGMADGLGYGMNTKAALTTRGLAELARLGTAMGGDPLTFLGLAGAGDLMATCSSPLSRNRRVGEQIGTRRRTGRSPSGHDDVRRGCQLGRRCPHPGRPPRCRHADLHNGRLRPRRRHDAGRRRGPPHGA